MRKVFILFSGLLLLLSCKKGINYPPDNNCITRINYPFDQVSSADSAAAIRLLDQNKISHTNATLAYVSIYNVPDGPNSGNYANIFVTQNINGLPVLSGDVWNQFINNVLQSTSGTIFKGYYPNSLPDLSLPQLRPLFFSAITRHANQQYAAQFQDSCLVATLGYYNLNSDINTAANLVKAWLIMPQHGSYPHVYLRDDNSALILYDPGLLYYDENAGKKIAAGKVLKPL